VTFLLVARHQKQREKKTCHSRLCVDSAGGSENDDSGEALTVTIVLNSTSLQIQKKTREKEEEEEKN